MSFACTLVALSLQIGLGMYARLLGVTVEELRAKPEAEGVVE